MRFAPNTTLVTGGASQTGLALSKLLRSAGLPVLFASPSGERSPVGSDCVKLDWEDATTFPEVFDTPHHIRYVYLLIPETLGRNPLPYMQPFIDLAIAEGVHRFVLLGSGEESEKGGNAVATGRIHAYIDAQGVECVALRSTESYSRPRGNSIREKNTIKAASASVEDIALAAFRAVTAPGRATHERAGAQLV